MARIGATPSAAYSVARFGGQGSGARVQYASPAMAHLTANRAVELLVIEKLGD
jgi:hypothetical protein